MKKYIVKRLLWIIPIMLLISFIAFSLMYLSPGDPAVIYLSQGGDAPAAEAVNFSRNWGWMNLSSHSIFDGWGNFFMAIWELQFLPEIR